MHAYVHSCIHTYLHIHVYIHKYILSISKHTHAHTPPYTYLVVGHHFFSVVVVIAASPFLDASSHHKFSNNVAEFNLPLKASPHKQSHVFHVLTITHFA